jgi:hypothetical protein
MINLVVISDFNFVSLLSFIQSLSKVSSIFFLSFTSFIKAEVFETKELFVRETLAGADIVVSKADSNSKILLLIDCQIFSKSGIGEVKFNSELIYSKETFEVLGIYVQVLLFIKVDKSVNVIHSTISHVIFTNLFFCFCSSTLDQL